MAVVNGFDTKAIKRRLKAAERYEIYEAYGTYYLTDGVMMIACDYDTVRAITRELEAWVPEEKHGVAYISNRGWEDAPIENLDRYLEICGADWNFSINAQEREAVANNVIEYGPKKQLAVEYLLTNGKRVLIDKAYYDIMAPAKKWGWKPKGRGMLNALHFRNQENEFEMWIMPIRRNKKESFMTVQELNHDELDELRQAVWFQANEYSDCGFVPELTREQLDIIDESDEIPDSLLHEIFAGIYFVKEDFLCNIKAEDEV